MDFKFPEFFKDFTGTIDQFRALLKDLEAGTAGPEYGNVDDQKELVDKLKIGRAHV